MKVLTWGVDLGDTEVMKQRNILQPLRIFGLRESLETNSNCNWTDVGL